LGPALRGRTLTFEAPSSLLTAAPQTEAPRVQQSIKRHGRGALRCASGRKNAAVAGAVPLAGLAETGYQVRVNFRFEQFPRTPRTILAYGTPPSCAVRLTPQGTLYLADAEGRQWGPESAPLHRKRWHQIELSCRPGAPGSPMPSALRLDGQPVTTASGNTLLTPAKANLTHLSFGWVEAPGQDRTCYVDDVELVELLGPEEP
jgi:hypothetical protein